MLEHMYLVLLTRVYASSEIPFPEHFKGDTYVLTYIVIALCVVGPKIGANLGEVPS